ncbi:extracellular solute-binding protein [Photobacterium sp. GSS17]|uniref:extracellular solute-binding protein n=1 Tax=Photobacterium sp. GSS17 TaxID=3020715 RepID=UPI00235FDF8A|nr:extracellular solute-binding protein [Photobacterium sp. GSS17]
MKKVITLALSLIPMVSDAALPPDVSWQTNNHEPLFASPDAKFGGTFRTSIDSFPQTFRTVGPDGNGRFRTWLLDGQPQLLQRHPDSLAWIPDIATHWAFGNDNKTIYMKLNPAAKWSDGVPLKATDFSYMLKFYRSKDIFDPWYNTFYTEMFDQINALDAHTIEIVFGKEMDKEDLLYFSHRLKPRPEHFYKPNQDANQDGVDDNFVRLYNFKPEPTLGAYHVGDIKKGKSITMEHAGKEWWGYSNRYYQHRYNPEKIRIRVIRDQDIAFKHFEKGDLDAFALGRPELWYDKTNSAPFQKGYIHKFWGYNQTEIGAGSFWLNTAKPQLGDRNVRKGIALALDIDGLNQNVFRGDFSRKPQGLGVGLGAFTNESLKPLPYDPQAAISSFTQAGFDRVGADGIRVNARGQRLSFAVTYSNQVMTPQLAYLKEQAKAAGLELTLNLVDGSSAFKYVLEKKHEISYHSMGSAPRPQYWEYFHSENANKPQNNNFTNYSTPQLDELIMKYRSVFSTKDKESLSREIQQVVHDANVIVPGVMAPYTREGYWRWIKYPDQPMQKKMEQLMTISGLYDLGLYWIDADVKKETQKAMKKGQTFEPVTIMDTQYKPR